MSKTDRQAFFEQEGVDQLVSMVLELATELWTLRERAFIFERVVERHGIPARELIEKYEPSNDEAAELAAMRRRMLEELMRTIGQPHRRIS